MRWSVIALSLLLPSLTFAVPSRQVLIGEVIMVTDGAAFLLRAYHFFEFTSLSTWMFKAWSATSDLSCRFSSWSSFILRASDSSIPSYLRRHR